MACCLHVGPTFQPHTFVQQHAPFSPIYLCSSSCQQICKSACGRSLSTINVLLLTSRATDSSYLSSNPWRSSNVASQAALWQQVDTFQSAAAGDDTEGEEEFLERATGQAAARPRSQQLLVRLRSSATAEWSAPLALRPGTFASGEACLDATAWET